MTVTWLGPARLLIETRESRVLVDPDLSDYSEKSPSAGKSRDPEDEDIFGVTPDVVVLTHDRTDEANLDTISYVLAHGGKTLVPPRTYQLAKALDSGNNCVLFAPGTAWTYKDLRFLSAPANHIDPFAIDVEVEAGGKKLYITANRAVFMRGQVDVCTLDDGLPNSPDAKDLENQEKKAPSSAYLHQRALLSVEQMIRENPAGKLDLKTLAARANLSPVYFHRIFTEYFGKTPSRYVLDCRVAAAKFRLITENESMAEVANACGFSSQAYFNCKFKELVGQTPLQYRKAMLTRWEN